MRFPLRLTLFTFALSQGIFAPIVACSDAGSTSGKRVQLDIKLTASAPEFTSGTGWSVKLSRALVSVGPQAYYEGATIFSHREAPTPFEFARFIGFAPRLAFAHPGHYTPGEVRGELLTSTSLDLVSGGGALGAGAGVTGVVRSGTFSFQSPAQGPYSGALGSNILLLEGTATKAGDARAFSAALTAADISDAGGKPNVQGCRFQETEISGNGTVTVSIDVAKWFELVEFELLAPSAGGDAVPLEGVAKNELIRGVRAGDRYTFTFTDLK